jgi:hypothetical protein
VEHPVIISFSGAEVLARQRGFLVAGLAVLLAGCASPGQGPVPTSGAVPGRSQQIVSHEDIVAEYQKTARKHSLPPHYAYPPSSSIGDVGDSYEVGWGALQAVDYWNCAWGKEWLEHRTSDRRRGDKAFAVYISVMKTQTYRTAWDRASVQQPFEEGVEAAELGDPSALQQDISVNCDDVKKAA